MMYAVLRVVARLALRWYYRAIEVVGRDRIPRSGPVLLAANHNNALIDALIVAASVDREVRLTAKATLLDHPLTRIVVLAAGIVPLRRRSDEASGPAEATSARNDDAFRAVTEALGSGGMILIFPEGKSHSEPALAPLKTGCARMALHAQHAGVSGIKIVPIGLTFERKGEPRSRVLMQIGEPIAVSADEGEGTSAVLDLTAQLDQGLRGVTLNFPSHDDARDVLDLSATLSRVLDRVRELDNPETPLTESVRVARRVDEIRRALPTMNVEATARVDRFIERLQAFGRRVAALGIPLNDVWMSTTPTDGAWFAFREVAIALVLGPIALWGRLNHWLPLRVALLLGRRMSRNPDEPAMHTLISGLVLVLVTYLLIAGLIGWRWGWPWAFAYLAALPSAASIDFWLSERMHRALQRARGFMRFRSRPLLQTELVQEAAWLRAEAARLDALIA